MTDRPEHGFSIHMTEGTLSVPGEDAHHTTPPTLDLRVSGIHSHEIEISMQQAKTITQTAIQHGADPFQDYRPEVGESAKAWADQE